VAKETQPHCTGAPGGNGTGSDARDAEEDGKTLQDVAGSTQIYCVACSQLRLRDPIIMVGVLALAHHYFFAEWWLRGEVVT